MQMKEAAVNSQKERNQASKISRNAPNQRLILIVLLMKSKAAALRNMNFHLKNHKNRIKMIISSISTRNLASANDLVSLLNLTVKNRIQVQTIRLLIKMVLKKLRT